MAQHQIARYSSLTAPKPLHFSSLDWAELIEVFGHHFRSFSKASVPGFGAHTLILHGQRNDASVSAVTLFVFDVDVGSEAEVQASLSLIKDAGLSAHLYSSYSHSPTHASYRLIIPPSRPVTPDEYPPLRSYLIRRFDLKVAVDKCSSPSHFWWMPSCPPEATPITQTLHGASFDVDRVLPTLTVVAKAPVPATLPDYEPPPEPAEPVDLKPLLARINRAVSWRVEHDARPEPLRRLLAGEPLAPQGSRNQTTTSVTATLANLFPEAALSTLMALIRPSLDAMIVAGSKLTERTVERMLLTAMKKRAERDASLSEFQETHRRLADQYRSNS